jgi:hypothetical protein
VDLEYEPLHLFFLIQARRSIKNGAPAFLAYIKAEPEEDRKLENIPVVCDYPDVFAEVHYRPDAGNSTHS